MQIISYNLLDNLLITPYKYIISCTEDMYTYTYIYITDTNYISDTNGSNDINDTNDTIENFNLNEINYFIMDNKVSILSVLLSIIFLIYFIMKLLDKYLLKIYTDKYNEEYNRLKNSYLNYKLNYKLNVNNMQKFITKGLFLDSILEMNANNNIMLNKIKVNTTNNYYALIRIKLKNSIEMHNSKYNLENINFNNKNNKFTTTDMYLIVRFIYNYNETNPDKMSQIIINIMNTINLLVINEFRNEDFVVLAISKDNNLTTNINNNEFCNGLKNINYELFNIKRISLDIEKKTGFTLLLPVRDIYDLFLDVYNNIIFESTSYKINSDNNECWYNHAFNEVF